MRQFDSAQGHFIMKIRLKKRIERLVEISFVKATLERKRCPCLRNDRIGVYCAKNLKRGEEVSDERREICDYPTLMARCLDAEKYRECIFYKGEAIL